MIEKVSVVITAHNRRKYLTDAVKSVLHQVNPGVEIEIVVVKNFVDDEIDSFLNNSGAVSIFTDEESFGSKLSLGIDASSGNIICFLDDDDMFNPYKIAIIRKIFDENKGLLFVHNDIQIISEERIYFIINEILHYHDFNFNTRIHLMQHRVNCFQKIFFSIMGSYYYRDFCYHINSP